MAVNSPQRTEHKTGPVLKVTKYDLISAGLIAVAIGLALVVFTLVVIWLTNRIPVPDSPPMIEMVEFPGGSEDGAPDETLNVESPEDPTDDPSVAEEPSEVTEIQEMLDQVLEVSDQATQMASEQFDTAAANTGNPGSAVGTGRRPLGMGDGKGGFPSEQRWFIQFADKGSLDSYARQLDFFGIELGVLMDGKLTYINGMSGSPKKRIATTGKDDRLYMNWQGGDRRKADLELFKRASVDAAPGTILHFYPKKTEQMLLTIEQQFANRKAKDIRRTYFKVTVKGGGYAFVVTKQQPRR